jgi:flavin reductase (DIM6/NTAB) family NADH-FMN oxidoreductase RutF
MDNAQARADHPAPHDLVQIDASLRLIDREVWIVTASDGRRRGGLVATWVISASIDRQRPVLLAALGANHFTTGLVQASRAFAAHLLRPDQIGVAWDFARDSGQSRDKLAGLATETRQTGSPILIDSLAWFDCRVFARHEAGARLFFWADVVSGGFGTPESAQTLREQHFFHSLTKEQRQTLIAARDEDAALYRPIDDQWRLGNPW